VRGLRSDPEQAAFWYQRARDLGAAQAERGLAPPNEPPSQPR
jgi:TPR repeat protein